MLIYEFDTSSLMKISSKNLQSDNFKRIINESEHNVISYPQGKQDRFRDNQQDGPIGISLTEFHLAIFYKSQVKIVCLLNKEVVYNQKMDLKVTFATRISFIP